jgi:hypothetical protein
MLTHGQPDLFFEVRLIETPGLLVIRLYPQHSSGESNC